MDEKGRAESRFDTLHIAHGTQEEQFHLLHEVIETATLHPQAENTGIAPAPRQSRIKDGPNGLLSRGVIGLFQLIIFQPTVER